MKKQNDLDELSCQDMVELYQRKGSFERCAKFFGVSPKVWVMYWQKNGCEKYLENNPESFEGRGQEQLFNYDSKFNDAMWKLANVIAKEHDKSSCRCNCTDSIWTKTNIVPNNNELCDLGSERFEIAVISDLHFGSTYQQLGCLNNFIKICKDRDIRTLVNAGDITENLMPRAGHKNERFLHIIDDIEQYCAENYPIGDFENSYFIIGNHDAAMGKRLNGYDIGTNLIKDRTDLTYLNDNPSLPDVIEVDGGARIQLFHGTSACMKSRTGRTMSKSIELRTMGQNFNILLAGHCHSSSFIPNYMGTALIGLPSFQDLTPYLAQKGLVSECGGLILSYQVGYNKIPVNVIPEFIFADQLGGIHKDDY
jgi:predicted phosphodiesterase